MSKSAFLAGHPLCYHHAIKWSQSVTQDVVNAVSQVSLSTRILPWAVAFGLLSVVLAVASKDMVVDLDLFHQMALYRQIESEGEMPTTDAFAYTPTIEPVVHHEWATGAVLYLATVKTGWGATGLVAIKYFLVYSICIGCFVYARRQGTSLAVFAVLAPFALDAGGWMVFNNVRAQLFTLFFLVIMFFLLDQDRKGKRWWIAVWFPIFIVWANMHGGVVSGMGILGVYCLAQSIDAWRETKSLSQSFRRVAHLVAVGLATLLLLNLNPYGWEYTPYLIRAVRMERPLIMEWSPIWEVKYPLFYTASVVIAAYGIWCRGKDSLFESMALILTAYVAAKHYRHGSLYAVTWACLLPGMIEQSGFGKSMQILWKKRSPQIAVFAVAVGLVAIGFSIKNQFWHLQIPGQSSVARTDTMYFPVGAVDYLREQKFQGNLFVPFASGAFVQWKLYPDVKISLDSRYEAAYPSGALEENLDFYSAADGWQQTLEKYETDALLVPSGTRLDNELANQDRANSNSISWKCVYRDRGYCLYFPEETAVHFTFVDRTNEHVIGTFP